MMTKKASGLRRLGIGNWTGLDQPRRQDLDKMVTRPNGVVRMKAKATTETWVVLTEPHQVEILFLNRWVASILNYPNISSISC